MSLKMKLAIVGAAACLLGGCASSSERTAYVAPERAQAPGTVVTDTAYVAVVERTARRRGIDVQWVNVPTKRVARQSP